MLYRGMDRAALDRQYNLRQRHPDHEAFFAVYARDSEAARALLPHHRDLAYGPHPRQRIDVFPAARSSGATVGAPLLAFLHGGYWQSMDKDRFSFLAPGFVSAGIAVAVVGYALCPDVSFGDLIGQVRDAMIWLHARAADWDADPQRLYVSGHSAGGHLTALLASTDWQRLGAPAQTIKGGIALSGIYDLEPIRLCYLNDALHLDAASAHDFSPIHSVPSQAPPLTIAVGGAESDEFLRQQSAFAACWSNGGNRLTVADAPDLHHFSIVQSFSNPADALHNAAIRAVLQG